MALDHGPSSKAASSKTTLNVLTGCADRWDMSPTTALESIPPERNAPYDTSDRIRNPTESERVSRT